MYHEYVKIISCEKESQSTYSFLIRLRLVMHVFKLKVPIKNSCTLYIGRVHGKFTVLRFFNRIHVKLTV